MARVQLTYPTPAPVEPVAQAPVAPTYADPPTKSYRNSLKLLPFGLIPNFPAIPFGKAQTTSVYDQTDPAVRALYGLDDPNRNATAPATTTTGTAGATTPEREYTPYTNYGVNNTGRTLSPNPNPSFSLNTTLGQAKAPTYPDGSGGTSMQGGANPTATGASDPFSGFLGGLFSLLTGKKQTTGGDQYEAALRERPEDIQRLVSMTQRPASERSANYGGFLGGMFDPKE